MSGTLYAAPRAHGYLDAELADPHHAALLAGILDRFGIRRGDRVIEIGAGTGRYTALLAAHGVRVTALEPDPAMHAGLVERLGVAPGIACRLGAADAAAAEPDIRALCGFHVLHHLDGPAIDALCRLIRHAGETAERFAGWFFLEPNPFNPLYPVQIALHPAMRFREERGIWATDRAARFARHGLPLAPVAHLGLVPPPLARRLRSGWLPRPRWHGTANPIPIYRLWAGSWSEAGGTPAF